MKIDWGSSLQGPNWVEWKETLTSFLYKTLPHLSVAAKLFEAAYCASLSKHFKQKCLNKGLHTHTKKKLCWIWVFMTLFSSWIILCELLNISSQANWPIYSNNKICEACLEFRILESLHCWRLETTELTWIYFSKSKGSTSRTIQKSRKHQPFLTKHI